MVAEDGVIVNVAITVVVVVTVVVGTVVVVVWRLIIWTSWGMWSERREKWGTPAGKRGNILASSTNWWHPRKVSPPKFPALLFWLGLLCFSVVVVFAVVAVVAVGVVVDNRGNILAPSSTKDTFSKVHPMFPALLLLLMKFKVAAVAVAVVAPAVVDNAR